MSTPTTLRNRDVRLARWPSGVPTGRDWEIHEGVIDEPGDGELLVRVEYVSLNPAM